MNERKGFYASRLVVAALTLAVAMACGKGPEEDSDYVRRLEDARGAKDFALRNDPDPIPDNLKATLLPLVYFAPDPSYHTTAVLQRSAVTTPQQMVYSDGVIRDVRRVGVLEFTLQGQLRTLAAFVEAAAADADSLFVPFADLTNRTETYPAGRLLDLQRTPTGFYDLDFNRAYNPYCYYSPLYSCPVTPKESQLPIAIRAGERVKPK